MVDHHNHLNLMVDPRHNHHSLLNLIVDHHHNHHSLIVGHHHSLPNLLNLIVDHHHSLPSPTVDQHSRPSLIVNHHHSLTMGHQHNLHNLTIVHQHLLHHLTAAARPLPHSLTMGHQEQLHNLTMLLPTNLNPLEGLENYRHHQEYHMEDGLEYLLHLLEIHSLKDHMEVLNNLMVEQVPLAPSLLIVGKSLFTRAYDSAFSYLSILFNL